MLPGHVRAVLFLATLGCAAVAHAQATPGVLVRVPLSIFVQTGDTYTGLGGDVGGYGGRNVPLTAGMDLGFLKGKRSVLSAEVRGTYPLYRGHVDGQQSLLAGLRLSYACRQPSLSRLLGYGNILAGRGAEHYVDGGFHATPTLVYISSDSAVYSAGLGFEIAVGDHLSFKAEAEFQRWQVPVTNRGLIYTKQGNVGVVYRFAGRKVR